MKYGEYTIEQFELNPLKYPHDYIIKYLKADEKNGFYKLNQKLIQKIMFMPNNFLVLMEKIYVTEIHFAR